MTDTRNNGGEAVSAWQPIETAPKDESKILVSAFITRAVFDSEAMAHTRRRDEYPTVCQAYFSAGFWQTGDFTFAHAHDATHWMPLPALPARSPSSKEA